MLILTGFEVLKSPARRIVHSELVAATVQAELDTVINDGAVHEDVLRITEELRAELSAILPDVKIATKAEPRYTYSHLRN